MSKRKSTAVQYLDYMLAAASDRIGRRLAAELERRGVSMESWRILNLLASGEGRTMGELAKASLLSLPTGTRIVDRMVSDSLVYRAPHENDRRKVLIFVSDKGLRVWGTIKKSVDRYQEAIADQYGDAWMQELMRKLAVIVDEGKATGRAKGRPSP